MVSTFLLCYIIVVLWDIRDNHTTCFKGNTRIVETTKVKIPKPPEVIK